MPSVRVRRGSQYSSLLGEDNADHLSANTASRPRSRTLASLFQPPVAGPSRQTADAQRHSQEGDISPTTDASEAAPSSFKRYSKVVESVRSSSLRVPHPLRANRSHPEFSVGNEQRRPLTLEGSQANVQVIVPTNGELGLLERSISSHHTDDDEDEDDSSSYDGSSGDELNHEDEIVEHLDVIDPEIATISNLANAANAILIPPIGVYSRKPVVVLPPAPPRQSQISETEGKKAREDDLDRHVEEVLSKREKIRRTLKGVWVFVKTPMGFITAIYGFLVVFWGAAIVLFLTKMINLHNPVTQGFWVEISSQIENALFTVTGVGLIPWRVIDTNRILRIWYYKRLTRRLREKANLPRLYDEDDLPDPMYDPNYVHVLSEKQEHELHHYQRQFQKSQTWYRPHGTATHRAFPITTALLICLFVDGNSFFQCILCGCMWGLNRFERPAWTTGLLIPASFLCGIVSAVLIWRGGHKTKRTKEVEERLRKALAMEQDTRTYYAFRDTVIEARHSKDKAAQLTENRDSRSSGPRMKAVLEETNDDWSSVQIDEKMEIPSRIARF